MAPTAKGPSGGKKNGDNDGASNNNDNNEAKVGTSKSKAASAKKKPRATTTKKKNTPKTTTQKAKDTNNNKGLSKTLDLLSREMAVAEYSKTKNGQYRRVTPKEVSLQKTRKRKALEKEDAAIAPGEYVEDGDNEATTRILENVTETQTAAGATRLRGSKVSLEHAVVEGSLPLLAVAAGRAHHNKLVVNEEEDEEDDDDIEEGGEDDKEDDDMEEEEEAEDLENDMDVDPEGEEVAGDGDEEGNDDGDGEDPKPASKETGASTSNNNSQKESASKKRGPYKTKKKTTTRRQVNSKKARRRLFRLKNFKSHRMAQRHGDALGAHARGQPVLAISLLKQVAKDAPSAPQVYSSLGMVYHDMFESCWRKVLEEISSTMDKDDNENNEKANMDMEIEGQRKDAADAAATAGNDSNDKASTAQNLQENDSAATKEATENNNTDTAESTKNTDNQQPSIIPPIFKEALDLAGKAYGSYHISAILCKKDYALWVRAADAACDMAEIYQQIMIHQYHERSKDEFEKSAPSGTLEDAAAASATKDGLRIEAERATAALLDQCREQQERWYSEAKNDFQVADNLKPPGLDIPIKLASVYMELGHFSEALTLWTDLLQRSSHTGQFRHTAWLLYAECMLHIGHKCQQWSAGMESTTKNYMFRRWLRKWSRSFDWQERRLQALVLALEAAAGSKACHPLMEWMRNRAQQQQRDKQQQAEAEEREQAAIAFAEALVDYNYRDENTTAETAEESPNDTTVEAGSNNLGGVANAGESTGETAKEGGVAEQKLDESQRESQSNEAASPAVEECQGKDQSEASPADEESQKKDQSNELTLPTDEKAEGGEQSNEATSPLDAAKAEFEAEKQLLLRNNEAELVAFDQTTEAMKEVYVNDKTKEGGADRTDALRERRDARRKLTRVHQAQVSRLEGEYQAKIEGDADGGAEADGENQDLASSSYLEERNIPIAASSGAVSKVAFELMKHMIDMGLYKGGRLAGEVVSLYMKERARICDKRIAARQRLNEQSAPFGALFGSSYDEVSKMGPS